MGAAATVRLSGRASTGYVRYSHHATPTVIATSEGDYLSVWHIGGRHPIGAGIETVYQWAEALNVNVRAIGEPGVSLWAHVVRRRYGDRLPGEFENPFARRLDERYRARIEAPGLLVNELYVTLVLRPEADAVSRFFAAGPRLTPAEKRRRQDRALDRMAELGRLVTAALGGYGGRLLGLYEQDGFLFCESLEFLGFLLNGERTPVPVCRDRISRYLPRNEILFDFWGECGEWRSATAQRRFGMLELRDYPTHTEAGHLNRLLDVPFEFVLTQSFAAMSLPAATGALKNRRYQLTESEDEAHTQVQQIGQLLEELLSGELICGEHHMTLLVRGADVATVRDHLALASQRLVEVGIIARPLRAALEAGFWAQLPGQWRYRPRPEIIDSRNLVCFSSLHNFGHGKRDGNPWGAAVALIESAAGGPFYFNFHVSAADQDARGQRALGNALVLGQSRAGKTVFIGAMLAMLQRHRPRAIVFDKDYGQALTVQALGGRYMGLRFGEASGLAPFKMAPTAANREFLRELLVAVAATDGERVTARDQQDIAQVVEHVMTLPLAERSFAAALQFLPDVPNFEADARPGLASRLRPWCAGEPLGWLFDNPADTLELADCGLYGIDMTEFLENRKVCGVAMMYLLHRAKEMMQGGRFIAMIDEAWRALLYEVMRDWIMDLMRTIAKRDGLVILATQEPGTVTESAIGKTLVQQTGTLIMMPNPQAREADYVEGLGLSAAQFQVVRKLPEGGRLFALRQHGELSVLRFDLAGMDEELMVLSGTPDRAARAAAVRAQVGEDPALWVPALLAAERGGKDVRA